MMTNARTTTGLSIVMLALVIVLFCSTFVTAQLDLGQTNWSGAIVHVVPKATSWRFTDGTITVTSAGETNSVMFFTQKGYTLTVVNAPGTGTCGALEGVYGIEYARSGQQLKLRLVQDECRARARLITRSGPLEFMPNENGAARNWLQLDAKTEGLAGISLDHAYELIKRIKPKPVIVAVIDNGVDLGHEDLKDVIWTNVNEIPGNGIDDDRNGYVDDIHGWNFRGAKDGTTVENEQSEATRIYSRWRNKYDQADLAQLNNEEKREWSIYTAAKKEHFARVAESKSPEDLKFAYRPSYNSSDLIGDDRFDPNQSSYGSPHMKLTPNLSHGTHVAGIIAAKRNNRIGIDGIAANAIIMPILATTSVGDERNKDVANAIRYAVNNGARIINLSFSKRFSPDKKVIDAAIQLAEQRNVLIVHAAGNDGEDVDIPANYHYPIPLYENGDRAGNMITVGWSRPRFDIRLAHPNSNYGAKNVDVFAPGSDIFSTVPGSLDDFKSGSSMSAPAESGIAALLMGYCPTLSSTQIKRIILESVSRPETQVNRPGTKTEVPFHELSATGGIVNAYNAVKMAIKLSVSAPKHGSDQLLKDLHPKMTRTPGHESSFEKKLK